MDLFFLVGEVVRYAGDDHVGEFEEPLEGEAVDCEPYDTLANLDGNSEGGVCNCAGDFEDTPTMPWGRAGLPLDESNGRPEDHTEDSAERAVAVMMWWHFEELLVQKVLESG